VQVAAWEAEEWAAMPCLTGRCAGGYRPDAGGTAEYFGRLYEHGQLQRIRAAEHTGLLSRPEREAVERQFKASGPDERRPWHANLLSCSPTLEMGVDIGDLSTVFLCSVPPAQASYLQRAGRAGRRDGSSFVLTVAQGRPHDLWFYGEPEEMMAGAVQPPGVYLDAPAVLERQLTAFCFDRWVAEAEAAAVLPRTLREVFEAMAGRDGGRFPLSFLAFVEGEEDRLLREFSEMFPRLSEDARAHLGRWLHGMEGEEAGLRWRLLNVLDGERRHRKDKESRARNLHEQIKVLLATEAKATDHDEQVRDLEAEKEALLALVRQTNQRQTLEPPKSRRPPPPLVSPSKRENAGVQ